MILKDTEEDDEKDIYGDTEQEYKDSIDDVQSITGQDWMNNETTVSCV